jgi:tetratricopeptide (TPR) repeat protein
MKKIVFVAAISLFCADVFAQDALNKVAMAQARKDKDKSDKNIQDPKANIKAATWWDRAQVYENIALQFSEVDSMASFTALDAYKKVVELDLTKKNEPGKLAKQAQEIVSSPTSKLYNAFIKQGAEKYQSQKLDDALKMFKKALEINTKDTLSALYGGIAAQQVNAKDDATNLFETYVTNGGQDPGVFYGLAQIYKNDNNFDKAINTLNRGLERSPDNKDLKSEIVNILLASGNEEKAIEELTSLTQKDPSNVQNLVNLAILYDNVTSGLGRKIRDLEEKVGASGSKKEELQKQLDIEKGKLEAYGEEIKRLGTRIKAQPKNADLKRQLAEVTKQRDASKDALAKLESDIADAAKASQGGDVEAAKSELTAAKAKQVESKAKAVAGYKKVLEVEATNYDALFNLGAIYFNEAVELKREVDNMNMKEYQARGKEVEGKVCGQFKKAKPYFEGAVKARAEEEAKETLATVDNILAQFEGKGVACAE